MKYANIIYRHNRGRLTIGDDMQLIAIESFYKQIGINYNEVIRIDFDKLSTYDGEDVILPISFPLLSYHSSSDIIIELSPKIKPVFLGVCLLTNIFKEEDIKLFKKYEPIGCRDYHTWKSLTNNGIKAYIGGCMTMTFPERPKIGNYDKYYCVDVPEDLMHVIPDKIRDRCEYISHTFYSSELNCTPEEKAHQIYNLYRDTAKLIITTRMHAALPCIAAGIPVVLFKKVYSYRFAGIDSSVKIYSSEDFDNINWEPKPAPDFEDVKQLMLSVAEKRVKNIECNKEIIKLDTLMRRNLKDSYYYEFLDNTIDYIKAKWKKEDTFEYAVWGITQLATMIIHYINKNYPNSKLVAVVDIRKRTNFCGIDSTSKEVLSKYKSAVTFICTGAAIQDANNYLGKQLNTEYYLCCKDNVENKLDN